MERKSGFNTVRILIGSAFLFWCMQAAAFPSYAQEESIAESFGLYSKGIEYYHAGRLYEAKAILERAIVLDPRNDEAQGYLDLVNAELRMRSKGRLDSYEKQSELKRESDFTADSEYSESAYEYYEDSGNYETYEPAEERGGYRYYRPEPYAQRNKGPVTRRPANPGKITGEIRTALGVTSEDIIWKEANGDNVGVPFEKNWRYLWGKDRYNTYDKKIYDSLMLEIDTDRDTGFNAYGQIVIDPWTFVGKTDVSIASTAGGDRVDMELKYWSNTRSTINEIYRSEKGNIINLKEVKVVDGKTTPTTPTGLTDWATNFDPIPTGTEIDWRYMPLRKLWVDYKSDEAFNARFFLMADQTQALTSDDPLMLSNNHVYWEESPWLDEYEPSRIFYPDSGLRPVKKGRWVRRLSFFAKDSDYNRLSFLRGISLNGELFSGFTSLNSLSYNMTVATPMSLWDDYENSTSIPLALRVKGDLGPDFMLGGIYTFKGGMNSGSLEALNQVLGLDAAYNLTSNWQVFGEIAASDTDIEEANGIENEYNGFAYHLGIKSEALKTKVFLTYMDQDFFPGLSNYRYTRRDQFYSKHIRFSELPAEDKDIAIGDGVDRGRVVLGIETSRDFLYGNLNTKANFRNVHKDNGKYVETVGRLEAAYSVSPNFIVKALALYKHLPKTTAGLDPLFYAKTSYAFTDYYSEEDIFMENADVEGDKDPSIGNFGLGARYDFSERLAWEGIYERTNDPGDTPRGLLNDSYVSTETRDGMLFDKMVPFLYDQDFFDLPPYDYYDIYKTKLIYKPFAKLTGILSFTRNVNKHAIGIDDNINHLGLEANYKYSQKLTVGLKYIYSKFIDVYRQNKGEGVHYEGHHNVFAEIDYNIDEYQRFSLLFGEFVGYAPLQDLYAPAKWSLSSLDTQHIVRMYYNRKF